MASPPTRAHSQAGMRAAEQAGGGRHLAGADDPAGEPLPGRVADAEAAGEGARPDQLRHAERRAGPSQAAGQRIVLEGRGRRATPAEGAGAHRGLLFVSDTPHSNAGLLGPLWAERPIPSPVQISQGGSGRCRCHDSWRSNIAGGPRACGWCRWPAWRPAAVAAAITLSIDAAAGYDLIPHSVLGTPTAAQTVLSTAASAMLTLTTIVLTVMTLGVQLAMQQFSPRIVRALLADRRSQLAHGLFAATFLYCMVAVAKVNDQGSNGGPGAERHRRAGLRAAARQPGRPGAVRAPRGAVAARRRARRPGRRQPAHGDRAAVPGGTDAPGADERP